MTGRILPAIPRFTCRTRIVLVQSTFHREITDGLQRGACAVLQESGTNAQIQTAYVAGAFELPLLCHHYAQTADAVIALGAVIRGETAHFDHIARTVSDGLMRVMLDTGCPVGFAVLTTDTIAQAQARAADDAHNKGAEAAIAVVQSRNMLYS